MERRKLFMSHDFRQIPRRSGRFPTTWEDASMDSASPLLAPNPFLPDKGSRQANHWMGVRLGNMRHVLLSTLLSGVLIYGGSPVIGQEPPPADIPKPDASARPKPPRRPLHQNPRLAFALYPLGRPGQPLPSRSRPIRKPILRLFLRTM